MSYRRLLARHAAPIGLLGYLVLAVAMLRHTWLAGNLDQRLVGGGGDPLGLVWFLAWLPHAVAQGHSPLFTSTLMAPGGANLLNSTSILLPSLVLWPVTSLAGPVLSYDVLATTGLATSAWAGYFALLRVTPMRSAAWIGGAIFGFGGYMAGQATAHANLLIAAFPPIVALLLDDVRRERRSPARTGLLLGLCSVGQLFVNEEMLATTTVMTGVALAFAWFAYRPRRAVVERYARCIGAAALVFLALAGPALAYQFLGPEHVRGIIVSSGRYVNDLLGFAVPNNVDWLSTAGARHLTDGFSGHDGEFGAYLGPPLILTLAWAAWRLRRRALLPAAILLTAALLSLGPHLRVGGADTGVLLPWALPNHLPLLENVVPARFNLYVWLAAAALVALLIEDLTKRPLHGIRLGGLAIVALALISVLPAPTPSTVPRVPAVLTRASAFQRLLPGAREILVVPSANGQVGMYAQAESDFAYRIPEGGVFVPTPTGVSYGMRHGPMLYALAELGGHRSTLAGRTATDSTCLVQLKSSAAPTSTCRRHYAHALRALRVDAVVVSSLGASSSVRRYVVFFTALLGAPRQAGAAEIFLVENPTT